jgi:glutamine amidotransferase
MPIVTVIDYGLGNLFSVSRALERCGAEVRLTKNPAEVASAEKLVLPGVGAFADGMQGLRDLGLIDPIRDYAARGKYLLGICLGMQMLFERGLEFGDHEGLGLLKGKVKQIPLQTIDGKINKVPHIGWNSISSSFDLPWEKSILDGVPTGEFFYFVHSYAPDPEDNKCRLADATYGGHSVSAVVRQGNIYGCQFHPEKSGPAGLKIITNFITM